MKPARILVGMSSCNVAAGSEALMELLKHENLDAELHATGCFGTCHAEPQIRVDEPSGASYLYVSVTPEKLRVIIDEHLRGGKPVERWIFHSDVGAGAELFAKQRRIVLRNCGRIDPESIDDYLSKDGYEALKSVLAQNDPAKVCETVLASGLRGRGGAGFPTGLKWKFALAEKRDRKYVVCNADEGDPGAFMDRTVLESDPHAVIEGMIIQAFATGASEGYVYCRAEYPLAIARLHVAIDQARERGYLGSRILDSDFSFDLRIKAGAGAFVCGEETALMASIEGERGMPRLRPPFPAQSGLFGKPTTINNVETLATVPWILRHGAEPYAAIGTEKSKGTKVFALAGKIRRGGLVEVPMGLTIREVVEEVGGGTGTRRKVKAVQLGGPSGGCVPASLLDVKIDYDAINATGAIMGSGGMIVMDDTTCMVDVARYFLDFTQKESCGKCTFCRVGTRRMLEILTRICEGEGTPEDLPRLEDLARQIKDASLCGLGQTAPNPVLTTLKYFREEYEEHVRDKKCRAGKCKNLCTYEIDEAACTGCTLCARKCPVDAIAGTPKNPHRIDPERCIRCGICRDVCTFDAVKVI